MANSVLLCQSAAKVDITLPDCLEAFACSHSHSPLACKAAKQLSRCQQHAFCCRERKNVNLPGVIVDLPTLTKKDEEDLVQWGLPNDIDFIAASFVRKGSDVTNIRKVRWPYPQIYLPLQLESIVLRSEYYLQDF